MSDFNRRRLLAGIAAGLVARPAFGQSAEKDISERMSQVQQDGKLIGLHAVLVA